MNGERDVHIGRDANNNVIVTDDDNRVYIFPGITQLTAELIARIETGQIRPEDVPGAVPLPALTLRIAFADDARTAWSVTSVPAAGPERERRLTPPWLAASLFAAALAGFWELSRRLLQDEVERQAAQAHALLLVEAARHDGPPPLLVIESAHDLILALPWELLRLEGRYAVEEGHLDVARCMPAEGAPVLAPPARPVTLPPAAPADRHAVAAHRLVPQPAPALVLEPRGGWCGDCRAICARGITWVTPRDSGPTPASPQSQCASRGGCCGQGPGWTRASPHPGLREAYRL